MSRVVLFYKPYGVLCQFTGEGPTLADYMNIPGVYAAGRLDKDSEGLVVLTDDGRLQAQISHPRHKMAKTYLAQVEGEPDGEALERLRRGVDLKDGRTRPAKVSCISPPDLPPRDPPIRVRKSIPTSWLRMTITEGRNRQVRRMTAHVGCPTLRLVRVSVGSWRLDGLSPGEYRILTVSPARPRP